MGRRVKERIARLVRHVGIQIKIFIRILLGSVILSGGVLGKNGVVPVDVVEHHVQVPLHVAQEFLISGSLVGQDQGLVHHGVVVAGGALRVFAVLIPVDAFRQILVRPVSQLLHQLLHGVRDLILAEILLRIAGNLKRQLSVLLHHVRQGEKHGHHRPAVVGRMEAAVQKDRDAAKQQDEISVLKLLILFRLRVLFQDIPGAVQSAEAEGGVRRGIEIAAGIVQASVVSLPSFDERKAGLYGVKKLLILIVSAFLTEIQADRVGQKINGQLPLDDLAGHAAIIRS